MCQCVIRLIDKFGIEFDTVEVSGSWENVMGMANFLRLDNVDAVRIVIDVAL